MKGLQDGGRFRCFHSHLHPISRLARTDGVRDDRARHKKERSTNAAGEKGWRIGISSKDDPLLVLPVPRLPRL